MVFLYMGKLGEGMHLKCTIRHLFFSKSATKKSHYITAVLIIYFKVTEIRIFTQVVIPVLQLLNYKIKVNY